MTYWPFWVSGLALAGVSVGHWVLLRKNLAVSGRFTALVDRLRLGDVGEAGLSQAELVAAIQAATVAEFGAGATTDSASAAAVEARGDAPPSAEPTSGASVHVVFLVCLMLGGLVSTLFAGGLHVVPTLRGAGFAASFGSGAMAYVPLVLGGLLVGFGTRMASGCTSGHGLSGASRFQPGSLVATAAFFGMGIAFSFVLEC